MNDLQNQLVEVIDGNEERVREHVITSVERALHILPKPVELWLIGLVYDLAYPILKQIFLTQIGKIMGGAINTLEDRDGKR